MPSKPKAPKYNVITWMVGLRKDHKQLVLVDASYQQTLNETSEYLFNENPTSVVFHRARPATAEDIQALS